MSKASKGGFYAVRQGKNPGVFTTWDDCQAQVIGFRGAVYKKFASAADAEAFVAGIPIAGPSSKSHTTTSDDADKKRKRRLGPDVENEEGWDVVYSDGACKGNGRAGSIAGVGVWWGHNDARNIAERCPGDQTNNRAELIAIIRVLEETPVSKKPLLIKTDSQYSMNCLTTWLGKWLSNGFRSATGAPIKNETLIRYLSSLLDARQSRGQRVQLQYVEGHSGDTGNDGADAQANMGTLMPPVADRDWEALEKQKRAELVKQPRRPDLIQVVISDDENEELPETRSKPSLPKARKMGSQTIKDPPLSPSRGRSKPTSTSRQVLTTSQLLKTVPPESGISNGFSSIAPIKSLRQTVSPPSSQLVIGRPVPVKPSKGVSKTVSMDEVDLSLYADCLVDDDDLELSD